MHKKTNNSTFKTPLLNDCTNNSAVQFKQILAKSSVQHEKVYPSYESPLEDIVTSEFIRGYN